MGCDIVFRFVGKGVSEEGTPSTITLSNSKLQGNDNSTLSNVADELLDNENIRIQLASYLKEQQYLGYQEVTEDILNTKGIIGNTNLSELKSLHPEIQWHECSNIPEILLVRSFQLNGQNFTGRIIEDGREIFIVKDDKYSLNDFSEYIRKRGLIESLDEINQDEQLIIAAHNSGFSTPKELMQDYILNRSKYKKSPYNDILKLKSQEYIWKKRRTENTDEFTSALILNGILKDNILTIKKSDFSSRLNAYHKDELKEKGIKVSDIKARDNEQLITDLFNEFFINNLESGEKYTLELVNDTEIVLRKVFPTLENIYGYDFQTVTDLLHIVEDGNGIVNGEYRGYLIYYKIEDGKTEYFCSLDSITNKSMVTKSFKSVNEVKEFIDKQYNLNNKIDQTANIGFKQLQSIDRPFVIQNDSFHAVGTVVKSLGIVIGNKVTLCPEDRELFYSRTNNKSLLSKMKDEYIKLLPQDQIEQFKKVIDTTEKAGVFLYLINEKLGSREDREQLNDITYSAQVNEILTMIEEGAKNPKYYYIEKERKIDTNTKGYERTFYEYKVIPVSRGIKYNSIFQRPAPIIDTLTSAAEVLSQKFGLKIEILNSNEIPSGIPADAKAWIQNGTIYVNGTIASTSDLMHEYTHLLLGVIKSQNFDFYEQMIDRIRNSKETKVRNKRIKFKQLYPNLSETDLNEEVFADLFGEYLAGKDLSFFKGMNTVEQEVNGIMTNAFPGMSQVWLDIAMKGKVNDIFSKLSVLMSRSNGISFGDNSQYRRASRLIEKWLKNNTLKEEC